MIEPLIPRIRIGANVRPGWSLVSLVLALALLAGEASAQTTTERVSVSSDEDQGNENSFFPSISADGRFVAFQSFAFNLQLGDDNETSDIFVHDRDTGETTLVSMHSNGIEGNNGSLTPSISADDGRFVAFQSGASNLVDGDNNGAGGDIFVHDRDTGETTLVSVDSDGNQGTAASLFPSISANGRFVAFLYQDTSGIDGIFVHDRNAGETTRVSVDSDGNPAESGTSQNPSISADGRFVAFESYATNLVGGPCEDCPDIYVYDLQTEMTTLVSVNSTGNSFRPSISADGRFVAFFSDASLDTSQPGGGVFVRDLQAGETTKVGEGGSPSISADGRFVAFSSGSDIFVRDRETGETTLVSVDSAGSPGNSESHSPSISANGSFVAFSSYATNLVSGDTNNVADIFVHGPLPPPCDLNGSGLFNSLDVLLFFSQCSDSSATFPCDLNGDGDFGFADVVVFSQSCQP